MSRLFRRDLTGLPPFVDARAHAPDVPGAEAVWYLADEPAGTGAASGHWIAPRARWRAGAAAIALTPGDDLPPGAEGVPVHVADPAAIPAGHPGPIVIAHLASYPCAAEAMLAMLDRMDADPRLHLETSGASIGNFIAAAVARHPGRVLFGSGAPRFDAAAQLGHVAAALPDDAALAMVLAGNARRVLGGGT